jgi:hypothetical protein
MESFVWWLSTAVPALGFVRQRAPAIYLGQWGETVSKPKQCNIREKSKQN